MTCPPTGSKDYDRKMNTSTTVLLFIMNIVHMIHESLKTDIKNNKVIKKT